MEVYYSSIKHHKLKRRVELKERKTLEILKNHFGQFHKLNMIIVNFILLAMVFQAYVHTTFMNTTFLYCKNVILSAIVIFSLVLLT